MMSLIWKGIWIVIVLMLLGGCKSDKVPLNEKQFTNLLIDLHKVDGSLSVFRGTGRGYRELKNYEYYNDLFQK